MEIYCCTCQTDIEPKLATGDQVYPGRLDLADKNFWVCNTCGNYVSCKSDGQGGRTLQCIPTAEIRNARKLIGKLVGAVACRHGVPAADVYESLSDALGWKFCIHAVHDLEEARNVYGTLQKLGRESELR